MTLTTDAALAADLAYEAAFTRHWDDVFRFALAWTNDWAAAEDLAQEAYLRLWRARRTVDWGQPIVPWLITTTRRLATDRFRALARRVLHGAAATGPDPAVADRWLDVRAAMARLSPLERAALVLTTVEGHPTEAVAALLGVSSGSVRSAVSRARAKLEADR
ncbi:MAG: sigma-70 family RNA polymerase sigma factor [Chloroflexota bacterium]